MRDINDLKRPTIADRMKCNDIAKVTINQATGEMSVTNTFAALVAWACVGLECKAEELDGFSDEQIKDIAERTKELASVPLGKV